MYTTKVYIIQIVCIYKYCNETITKKILPHEKSELFSQNMKYFFSSIFHNRINKTKISKQYFFIYLDISSFCFSERTLFFDCKYYYTFQNKNNLYCHINK